MISAILLAAGKSKRMNGENKLCKKLHGIPMINHSIKNILSSSIDELIIVLGHENKVVQNLIKKNNKIKFILNNKYETGIASSIKTGIKCLSINSKAFFICLGDMPMVNKNVYNKLINSRKNEDIIIPTYKGIRGNPILFSKSMINQIMNIEGDIGAKNILNINKNILLHIEIDDEGIRKDFNFIENFNF